MKFLFILYIILTFLNINDCFSQEVKSKLIYNKNGLISDSSAFDERRNSVIKFYMLLNQTNFVSLEQLQNFYGVEYEWFEYEWGAAMLEFSNEEEVNAHIYKMPSATESIFFKRIREVKDSLSMNMNSYPSSVSMGTKT